MNKLISKHLNNTYNAITNNNLILTITMFDLIKKSEALTVAILTASCYVTAYLFECGYNNFFSIPNELISISVGEIISTTISLFVASVIAFFGCTFPYVVITRHFGYYKITVIASLIASFITFILLNIFLISGITRETLIKASLAWIIITLVMFFCYNDNDDNNFSMAYPTISKIHDVSGSIFWLGLAYIIFVSSCGTYIARQKTIFHTFTSDNTKYAIINIYGDNFIAKKLKNNKPSGDIFIFRPEDFKKKPITTYNPKTGKP